MDPLLVGMAIIATAGSCFAAGMLVFACISMQRHVQPPPQTIPPNTDMERDFGATRLPRAEQCESQEDDAVPQEPEPSPGFYLSTIRQAIKRQEATAATTEGVSDIRSLAQKRLAQQRHNQLQNKLASAQSR